MMNDFIALISNVGFPIAACTYLAVSLKPAVDKLKEAVDNNTSIMERLLDRSERKE